MASYGRVYKHNEEKARRQAIFKQNLEFIERFNNEGNKSFRLSLNRFADLTNEEFVASHTGAIYNPQTQQSVNHGFGYQNVNVADIESSLDWRKKGAVNKIKNQHRCGT